MHIFISKANKNYKLIKNRQNLISFVTNKKHSLFRSVIYRMSIKLFHDYKNVLNEN